MKQNQIEVVKGIQNDPNKVIISNFLTILSFKKAIGDDFFDVDIKEIGTHIPKIVWEMVSMLKYEDIENATNGVIIKRLYIKEFLKKIGSNENNYKHIINGARMLRAWEIATVEDGKEKYKGFFSEVTHDRRTGYLDLEIKVSWAKIILEVAEKGNVSFLTRYLHILQNSHAINLYPTLQAHVYKGKYEISVEDFKNTFNYNSTGYKKFSNLKTYVLEPAIQELNEKSDLVIYCEPTGSNLESKKPRVIGLIFWIKEKPKEKPQNKPQPQDEPSHISNKIKDVPFVEVQDEPKQEPRKEQPKPQSITTPPPTGASVPSESEIQQLADKLKLNPEQVQAIKNKLDNNSIRVFEVLQGCINEIKAGNPIKSNIAYILGSIDTLGLGIYAQKQDKLHKEQEKQIRENAQQQEQKQIKKIINSYNLQSDKDFLKAFEELNEEQQAHYQIFIAKKLPYAVTHYYTNNELNEQGKALAGQYDIFGESYDRDNEILRYARSQGISLKKDPNKETKFALDGLITVETLTAEPQPQSIEATPPTAPSMATAPLPQVSEVVEPSEPPHEEQDDNQKSRKQLGNLSSTDIEEMKNVETPKSFGSLLKNLFR